jgi:arsenic resistance protein ArsH
MDNLPNISAPHLDVPSLEKRDAQRASTHAPRILLLYGSLRETSYSRLLMLEAERLMQQVYFACCTG